MKTLIYRIILLGFFLGCSPKTKLEKKIEHAINDKCDDLNKCNLNLSGVTNFNWNKLYVFKESAQPSEIEAAIGRRYPYYEDVARRLVFMDNNKIVYHEDVFPSFEGIPNGQILFDMPDTVNYKVFLNKEFIVQKYTEEKRYYYVLSQ